MYHILLMEAKLSRERRGAADRSENEKDENYLCVAANFTRGFLLKPSNTQSMNTSFNLVLKIGKLFHLRSFLKIGLMGKTQSGQAKPAGSMKTRSTRVFLGQLHLRSCVPGPTKPLGPSFFGSTARHEEYRTYSCWTNEPAKLA